MCSYKWLMFTFAHYCLPACADTETFSRFIQTQANTCYDIRQDYKGMSELEISYR